MTEKKIPSSEKFWSDFAEDYDKTLYEEVKEYPSLIVRHKYILDLFDKDSGKVLDIGCGPGKMLIDLMKRDCSVVGVDIAEGMIEMARKNIIKEFPEATPDLALGDIENLRHADEEFDAVISSGVVEYLSNDDKALKEMNRIMKPGGTLIITVRNKACPLRVFDLISDFFKNTVVGLKFLNSLRRIVKGSNCSDIAFTQYRKHWPWELKKNLKQYGFEKIDFRYYHFYPFFIPFDKFLPAFFIKQGLKMESLTNTSLGWLASGYIIKARKTA